ncbi:hypothetical protein BDV97DRAFT_364234 [Delphinella strobiligena]|nr:hypothetical protein BDV97DRAFT_364234 [Delphinella strobiligena]
MADELRSSNVGRLASSLTTTLVSKESSLTEDQLIERFVATIDAVHTTAPKAHIMLVEYLTLFGTDTKAGSDVWMDENRIAHHREVAAMLQRAYTRAAEQRDNVPSGACSSLNGCTTWVPDHKRLRIAARLDGSIP